MSVGNVISGAGGLMSGMSAIGGGIAGGIATRAQGELQATQYELAAERIKYVADQEIKRGQELSNAIIAQGNQLQAVQRVSYAAGNIDVRSGTVSRVQDDTEFMSQLNASVAKHNGYRAAMGLKFQSADSLFSARATRMAASASASAQMFAGVVSGTGTLLATGAKGAWQGYQAHKQGKAFWS